MPRPNQHWRCDNCQWSQEATRPRYVPSFVDLTSPKWTPEQIQLLTADLVVLECRCDLPDRQEHRWPEVAPSDWCRDYEPTGSRSDVYDFPPSYLTVDSLDT